MKNFYFVIRCDVLHPGTYEPLLYTGTILNADDIKDLADRYGFDHIPCEVAIGTNAAYKIQNKMLLETT